MTGEKYEDAVAWLFSQIPSYQNTGKSAYKPGLDNTRKLCEYFGNPQERLKMIHIGGTNGKGSTSNMLASVLQEAGYKVGLYTSPHLVDFTERIRVNGEKCERDFVYDFIQKLKELPDDIHPSFFEFTTVMAFEYFRLHQVDYAIIEVGLGGRLDSTNIIQPVLTAITNVALDHQDILGDTLGEIAVEKAGIIKNGVPLVCGAENPEVRDILQKTALTQGAEFIDATSIRTDLKSDLLGDYQQKNIRVVIALVNRLRNINVSISNESLSSGLLHVSKNTGFMGRWFIFSKEPLVICDTAHNQAGLELVFKQLNAINKTKHIILGFVAEKKIDQVLPILPVKSKFYFVKPNVARGRSPQDYEDLLQKEKINYKIFENLQNAYVFAKQELKNEEMIFIGGSNFIVGEFLEKNLDL